MPPREPRSRGGPSKPNPAAVQPPAAAAAPTEIPPNKKEIDLFELPSAKTGLREPIELGNANPMRLHVKNNPRIVTYNPENEKRLALQQRIDKGQLSGLSVKTGATGISAGAAKGPSVLKRPATKRAREI